jgi:hypothetical protein
MRRLLTAIIITLALSAPSPGMKGHAQKRDVDLIIEGTVLSMSPPTPGSGVIAFYRLVKYKVNRVCKGRYSDSEIVVDHWVVTTKELEGVKIGDKVCFAVNRSKRILRRWNADGIRATSDLVPVFYIGNAVAPPSTEPCDCVEAALSAIGLKRPREQ